MKDRYYAGFMTDKPTWLEGLAAFRKQTLVLIADIIALIYLWFMVSYAWNYFVHHTRSFATLPWWVMLIVVVEAASLWQNYGVSIGMKLVGQRLVDSAGRRISPDRRALRFLLWHLTPLAIISLAITTEWKPWHDRVTELTMVGADRVELAPRPWYRRSWSIALLLICLSTLVAAMLITRVDLHALFSQASKTRRIWAQVVHPDWSLLGKGVRLLLVTVFMAFVATLFGVVVAAPLSFLAARNLTQGLVGRTVYTIVRVTMSIVRSIEPIIWAIIFVVWVRLGAFPGVLALFVHSVADLTKLYSERLESIDPGPVEAIRATGANRFQVILYGVVPQIINPYLSFTLYRWDINVRMATIIGIVGGGGIGQSLIQYTRVWDWSAATVMMLLIMAVVWLMDYTSSRLRARLG
jgi:phosphonate transport system permease protein